MKCLNKTGVISLMITFLIIFVLIYFPYISFSQSNEKIENTKRIIDLTGNDLFSDLLMIPFWYAIFLIIESTVIITLNKMHIWLFIFQALVLTVFLFFISKILPLCLFCTKIEMTPFYYLILSYLILGIIVNLLIAGSISDSNKNGIIKLFDKLSLLKK